MHPSIHAIYENGVLKLLEPHSLRENERVKVAIFQLEESQNNLLDSEFVTACAQHASDAPSLEEVRKALSVISGALTEDFALERDED